MTPVKSFKTYDEQVDILVERGMQIPDRESAIEYLARINYYRLSGYWYPFRRMSDGRRIDEFYPGTTFPDVIALYDFDSRLRTTTFDALASIELGVRSSLGHALGDVDECAHLRPSVLNARARGGVYADWRARYEIETSRSQEDIVQHHRDQYGGELPVWVAVEVLGMGALRHLYSFAPRPVQERVAEEFGLLAPQLESWLKSLEIVRNTCAHHGRLFNRVFTKTPRLPVAGRFPDLDAAARAMNRTFGQLSLIQHMRQQMGVGPARSLPRVLETFPSVRAVPLSHVGATDDWRNSSLWAL